MNTSDLPKKWTWATVPHNIRKLGAEFFTIPQELEHELLPSASLSIAKMLEFPLPLQTTTALATQRAQFFSSDAPNITDKNLLIRARRLAIPDRKTVQYTNSSPVAVNAGSMNRSQ
ncbi:hypothetical protein C8F04DRAFT_1261048 [Mycena alexandri]|uniref:Uncharacterized protein n=1 Tax=Mycena alexandri TaxID=1745969 RepID=A0AAD6SSR9_9AGAR|nr:hypothetical protein C8F04DRAFT_1261048 [Mycena alexandri]